MIGIGSGPGGYGPSFLLELRGLIMVLSRITTSSPAAKESSEVVSIIGEKNSPKRGHHRRLLSYFALVISQQSGIT